MEYQYDENVKDRCNKLLTGIPGLIVLKEFYEEDKELQALSPQNDDATEASLISHYKKFMASEIALQMAEEESIDPILSNLTKRYYALDNEIDFNCIPHKYRETTQEVKREFAALETDTASIAKKVNRIYDALKKQHPQGLADDLFIQALQKLQDTGKEINAQTALNLFKGVNVELRTQIEMLNFLKIAYSTNPKQLQHVL